MDREVTFVLTPGGGTFATASWFETSDQYFNTASGTGTATVTGGTVTTGFTANGLGATSISNLVYGVNGSGQQTASFNTSSPGGSGNGYGFSQSLAVNAASGLVSGVANGYDTLTMTTNPSGGQANNSIVDVTIDIAGNYAAAATLVSYNTTGWSLVQDFVYNAGTNETVLQIENTSYQGNGAAPAIYFTLQGAFVPEPGSLAVFGSAIAALLGLRRRQGRLAA